MVSIVCVHVHILVCECARTHIHACVCMCAYTHVCMHVCVCVCMCVRGILIIGSANILAADMLIFTILVIGTACPGSQYKYR